MPESTPFKGDRYYRIDEIAEKLKVSTRTIRRLTKKISESERLQSVRIESVIRVYGGVINDYLEKKEVKPEWE